MDDEADGEASGARRWVRVNGTVPWSEALGAAIVARVRRGESVRAMGRTPGLPQGPTIQRWLREKPAFAAAVDAARKEAGCPFKGSVTTYCEATAREIFERLCNGEGLVAICRDPAMPAVSTVRKWRLENADFRDALEFARDVQADLYFERGWDLCEGATPETAYLTRVRLGQVRWAAGKLAPRKYGSFKPAEAPRGPDDGAAADGEDGPGGGVTLVMKTYYRDPETGAERPTDEPGEVLWSRAADGTVSLPSPEAVAAREAREADFRRAFAEAKRAQMAAEGPVNGMPKAQYWPPWWREAYPEKFRARELDEADEARRLAERKAERAAWKARRAAEGLPPADWMSD